MKRFDIVFKGEFGEFKMEDASNFTTEQMTDEAFEALEGVGLGKIKEITLILNK